jgi:hypothetical protein
MRRSGKTIKPEDDLTKTLVRYRSLTRRLQVLQDRLARPDDWIPRWQAVTPDFDFWGLLEHMHEEAVQIQIEIDQTLRSLAEAPQQEPPPGMTAPQSLAELLAEMTWNLVGPPNECALQFGIQTHPSDGAEIMYAAPNPPEWGGSDWEFKAYLQSGTTELVSSPQDATGLAFKAWVTQMHPPQTPSPPFVWAPPENHLWTVFVLEYTFPEAPCDARFGWAAELVASFPNGVLLSGDTMAADFYWTAAEDPAGLWSLSNPTPPLWGALLHTEYGWPDGEIRYFTLGAPVPAEHHQSTARQGGFDVSAGVRPRLFLGLHVRVWAGMGTVAVGGWNALLPNSNLLSHGQLTIKAPPAWVSAGTGLPDAGSAPGVAWFMEPLA